MLSLVNLQMVVKFTKQMKHAECFTPTIVNVQSVFAESRKFCKGRNNNNDGYCSISYTAICHTRFQFY